jgi:hypothetical protein
MIAAVILILVQLFLIIRFSGWVGPASVRRRAAEKELAGLQRQLAADRALLGQAASIWQSLDQSAAKLQAIEKYAPSPTDRYAWAYEYISHRAAQAQISLNTLEEIPPAPDNDSSSAERSFDIRIATRCDYNSLVEFLWRLEKDNPLLRIKTVTIGTVPGTRQAPHVQAVIQWLTSLEAKQVEK